MVVPFPTSARRAPGVDRHPLDDLLRRLHGAGDDEELQAAVDRIAEGERQAVLAGLQKLCGLIETGAGAPHRLYIPY